MEKSQMFGLIIVVGAMAEMAVFLFGIAKRSYLALAMPMLFSSIRQVPLRWATGKLYSSYHLKEMQRKK